MSPVHPRRQRGVTLPELLVAGAVLGVVAAMVLPRLGDTAAAGHAADARAALLRTYATGNRFSSVHGRHVVACPSAGTKACADGHDWTGGWILFADMNGDRRFEAGDRLIEGFPALDPKVRLISTRGRPRIVFQPQGGNAGSNVSFTLCDTRGARHARHLVLANHGRLREQPAPADAASSCLSGFP